MSANIWITSDWHFGHDRDFIWKARGFSSVDEMNLAILLGHNKLVAPEEEVYVLGDLMLGNSENNIHWISKMNGKLHIVRGNHCTNSRWELYKTLPNVVETENAIFLDYKKYHFYLSHFPTITSNNDHGKPLRQQTLNLYGHTHQNTNFFEDNFFMYHVGMDSHNCLPVNLDDIIVQMREKRDMVLPSFLVEEYREARCSKCVWEGTVCGGPSRKFPDRCPDNIEYKRDPPDGGYYG